MASARVLTRASAVTPGSTPAKSPRDKSAEVRRLPWLERTLGTKVSQYR